MSEISCKICFKIYGEDVSPRMLPCGHSVCYKCLTKLVKDSKSCPICRSDLSNENEDVYPVNYSLLEVCELVVNSKLAVESLKKRVKQISEKHDKILEKFKNSTQVQENQIKLRQIMAKDIETSEINNLTPIVNSMEEILNNFIFDINSIHKDAKLLPKQFQDASRFLYKIYSDIALVDKNFIAVCDIDGKENAAKLSIDGDKLLLHCLQDKQRDSSQTLVLFDDVRKCMIENGYFSQDLSVFFDFKVNAKDKPPIERVFLKMICQSDVSSLFLTLCTGEKGTSYIGNNVKKKTNSEKKQICSFNFQNKFKYKYYEYFIRDESDRHINKYNVAFSYTGGFSIIFYELGQLSKKWAVIGEVDKDYYNVVDNFPNDVELEIVDCGIGVNIKNKRLLPL